MTRAIAYAGIEETQLHLLRLLEDPTQRQPDITLAKSELGWEPGIALEQGLKKTIDFFSSTMTSG